MKRIVVAANWFCLLLALGLVEINHSIQVLPDAAALNTTREEKSVKGLPFYETTQNITHINDAQLSASERNRRLIPYMAFYLPPSEIPINQAYAVQRQKQQQQLSSNHKLPPTAADSGGPVPPPAHIPIPTAYVHMKVPASAIPTTAHDISQDYPNAGDVYHKIAYGGQFALPQTLKNAGKKIPILHLLPPGAAGPSVPAAPTLITYKHNSPHRQKTVQHFPPITTNTKTQVSPQLQPQLQQIPYQQPAKTSKINLTPFTSSNTLPGHFIPIIYTPVSSANNNNNNQQTANIINYSYDDNKPAIEERPTPIQQVEKQPHKSMHSHAQQQQIVAELELLPTAPEQPPKATNLHAPQQQQQVQFITVTGSPPSQQTGIQQPVAAVHPTANPTQSQYIDYIIEEPKQSLDEEQLAQVAAHAPKAPLKPTLAPPQAAYIVITTALPPYQAPKPTEYYGSTMRPAYKNQPTLRLQPIVQGAPNKNYVTRRPVLITPTDFSTKPKNNQVAIKLKSAYSYEAGTQSTPVPHTNAVQSIAIPATQQTQQSAHFVADNNNSNKQPAPTTLADPNQLPDIRSSSLAEILHKLQASNHLPQTLTADNIDNSIKTLITILNNLKQTQTIVANPPQHHDTPPNMPDYDYNAGGGKEEHDAPPTINVLTPIKPNKHPGPSTGRPGIDYPNYAEIPQTSFDCTQQRYKGFFGDPETNCQVWHYCDLNGGKASFLCPNGTIFSQIALTCDWWFNVKCSTTAQLYVLNERLYKYILPFTPKFPEDYSGPLVDKYLAMKFQEMEEKMRVDKEEKAEEPIAETTSADNDIEGTTLNNAPSNEHKHEAKNSYVSEQSSERNLLIDDEVIDDEDDNDSTQQGSVATYASSTPATSTSSTNANVELPLSIKPIVVSSTEGPDYAQNSSEEQDTKQSEQNTKKQQKHVEPKLPGTSESPQFKVSVEKVEVIEIKSDGTSGHLTPAELYKSR